MSELEKMDDAGTFGRLNEALMIADFDAAQDWMKHAL